MSKEFLFAFRMRLRFLSNACQAWFCGCAAHRRGHEVCYRDDDGDVDRTAAGRIGPSIRSRYRAYIAPMSDYVLWEWPF